MRRALLAGQLPTQHLKRDIECGRRQLRVLDPISNHFDRQSLGVADGFLARLSVGHHAREFKRLSNPPAIILQFDLNGNVHCYIVSWTSVPEVGGSERSAGAAGPTLAGIAPPPPMRQGNKRTHSQHQMCARRRLHAEGFDAIRVRHTTIG